MILRWGQIRFAVFAAMFDVSLRVVTLVFVIERN